MDPWYFAYGSNLHRAQLIARCGLLSTSDEPPRMVRLPGYQLAFNMAGGDRQVYANVVTPGTGVIGIIYRCGPAALAKLDVYEAGYDRRDVTVIDDQKTEHQAIAYVARPDRVTTPGRPHPDYLHTILTGAREHGLPEEYFRSVEQLACQTFTDLGKSL